MVENAICQLSHLALGWVMIRWYDYPAALLAADIMLTMAFTIPYVGFVAAYALYEFGWEAYCQWRLKQEHGK